METPEEKDIKKFTLKANPVAIDMCGSFCRWLIWQGIGLSVVVLSSKSDITPKCLLPVGPKALETLGWGISQDPAPSSSVS